MTRGDRWAPVLVAVVATAIGGFGIGARDLAGDEIHMLVGDPVWIADRALDPRAGFVGHLPWSYWLRWCVQTVAGDAVWTWRLHSVVGAALATGLTCSAVQTRLGRRAGVIAGLMVALCPILAFHAQDSSNYAWSAASGALILGGMWSILDGKPHAARWLTAGLLVGVLNDVYFAFLAISALGLGLLALRQRPAIGRTLLMAWAPTVAVTIPAAFLFGVRLLEATTGAVVDVHADLPAPSGLPWFLDAVWLPLRRLSGSMLAGYASGRVHDHWEVWPTVGFTVLAIGLSLRTEARRPARVLLVALGVFAVASLTFRATTGRSLPHEPRVFLTLLPFLATTWIAALRSLRPSLRPVALSLLAVSISTETGVQLWSRSTMHRDAALLVANSGARLHAEGLSTEELHVIVPDKRIRDRLPETFPRGPHAPNIFVEDCLSSGQIGDAAVMIVRNQPLDVPQKSVLCGDGTEVLATHTRIGSASFGPPEHERNAASFLMPVQVELLWPQSALPSLDTQRAVALTPTLLSGTTPQTQVSVWSSRSGAASSEDISEHMPFGDGRIAVRMPTSGDSVRLTIAPETTRVPDWDLLAPFRRTIQSTEAVLAAPLNLHAQPVALVPLRDPTWQVALRMMRALLTILLMTALTPWGRSS